MTSSNLVLQSPIIRSWHDLFPTAGRGQAALRHQPTPGEQLVRGDAMPTSHQAYRHTRFEGLFDHANLLRGRPAPTTLNRRDDLNAIGRIGHRHSCMPHTCQVGDRVRLVRGLSHHERSRRNASVQRKRQGASALPPAARSQRQHLTTLRFTSRNVSIPRIGARNRSIPGSRSLRNRTGTACRSGTRKDNCCVVRNSHNRRLRGPRRARGEVSGCYTKFTSIAA